MANKNTNQHRLWRCFFNLSFDWIAQAIMYFNIRQTHKHLHRSKTIYSSSLLPDFSFSFELSKQTKQYIGRMVNTKMLLASFCCWPQNVLRIHYHRYTKYNSKMELSEIPFTKKQSTYLESIDSGIEPKTLENLNELFNWSQNFDRVILQWHFTRKLVTTTLRFSIWYIYIPLAWFQSIWIDNTQFPNFINKLLFKSWV